MFPGESFGGPPYDSDAIVRGYRHLPAGTKSTIRRVICSEQHVLDFPYIGGLSDSCNGPEGTEGGALVTIRESLCVTHPNSQKISNSRLRSMYSPIRLLRTCLDPVVSLSSRGRGSFGCTDKISVEQGPSLVLPPTGIYHPPDSIQGGTSPSHNP